MQLKPYPEYKKAGVSWIGSIPAHWPEKRAKYYFKEIDERSQTGDEEMLSVSHITGVTPRSQKNVTMFKAESNVGQKRCRPGDVVINTMWAWMSALGVSNHAGIVSPAYGVYRPINDQEYDTYYLDHLLRIAGYRSEYICRSTGVRSSRLRLYPDKFLSMRVICPPWEEQQAIVRFLKAQNLMFRKFIRNKRRLIELLKEQKQNIINQAVTRGIDPNVKLKPSGVEWIGDIPEHWEALPVRRCAKLVKTGGTPAGAGDENFFKPGFNWFTPGDFKDDLYLSNSERQLSEIGKKNVKIFPPDTVMMTGIGNIGKAAISRDMASCNQQINGIVPNERVEIEFFTLSLRSAKDSIVSCGKFTTIPIINQDETKSLRVPVPHLSEQKVIVSYINKECLKIDCAITRTQREIELMREYRSRLIADVVTGQVDVRGIDVPEVAEEAGTNEYLPLHDEDTADDDDLLDADEDLKAGE
jgi:type I restriction enzyme S subunit